MRARHGLVVATAWASKAVALGAQLVIIRIVMDAVGSEGYAVYALLLGLIGWFQLADLGLGSSLQNYISEERARQMPHESYIAASAAIAIVLLMVSIALLYLVSPWVAPWLFRKFDWLNTLERVDLLFVTGTLFLITSIGGLSYKVWYAEQRGYLANLLPCLGAVLGLGASVLVSRMGPEHDVLSLIAAYLIPSALLPAAALALQVTKARRTTQFWLPGIARDLLARAMRFWFFAVMAAVVLQIDYLVISQMLSPGDIVVYSLAMKVFGLVFFLYSAVLSALWPSSAEAIAQGRWATVIGYLRRYTGGGALGMAAATVVLLIAMPILVNVVAPNQSVVIPAMLIVMLGAYYVVRVWTDTYAMVLQSMSALTPFWILVPMQALISLVAQWQLSQYFGLHGIVGGLILAFLVTVSWGLPFALHRYYRDKSNASNQAGPLDYKTA